MQFFDERTKLSVSNWLAAGAAIPAKLIPSATQTERQRRAAEEAMYQIAYNKAQALLMTGPRATPPRPNTVRRMMRLLKAGGPSIKGAVIQISEHVLLHPTKGMRRV